MKKRRYLLIPALIALTAAAYSAIPGQRSFVFEYDVELKGIPAGASEVKIWIPSPLETPYQQIEALNQGAQPRPSVTRDDKYNNRILYYLLMPAEGVPERISLKYRVKRYERINRFGLTHGSGGAYDRSGFDKYLEPGRLVTISPRVKRLAAGITRGRKTDMEKARAIYDYVFENVAYDKTVPGWGRGDTERVCDVLSGNCTDFHSLFISLARAAGIPARFIIGVPIPADREGQLRGYHCWAEFYIDGSGWIPVDISEAWKDRTKYEYHFGAIDENRVALTRGRDINLHPPQGGEPLNYFIYPYVEVDGKVFEGVDVIFKFHDVSGERG